jgi:hypothetical protein
MRRDDLDPLHDREAGVVGIDCEGGNAACSRRLAGAGEDGIDIGDAAVGNPGFLTVENIVVAL